jgi:putative membrane protein
MNTTTQRDNFWFKIIYLVSALVCLIVAFMFFGPRPLANRLDVSMLPKVNATLNALTALALMIGFYFIKARRIVWHRRSMFLAFGLSTLFLLSYVTYHVFQKEPQHYLGSYRGIYLSILLSHIVLAAVILPMALVTLYRGHSMQLTQHRRIAKITLPLWLYVSITGIVVYWMLYA